MLLRIATGVSSGSVVFMGESTDLAHLVTACLFFISGLLRVDLRQNYILWERLMQVLEGFVLRRLIVFYKTRILVHTGIQTALRIGPTPMTSYTRALLRYAVCMLPLV